MDKLVFIETSSIPGASSNQSSYTVQYHSKQPIKSELLKKYTSICITVNQCKSNNNGIFYGISKEIHEIVVFDMPIIQEFTLFITSIAFCYKFKNLQLNQYDST